MTAEKAKEIIEKERASLNAKMIDYNRCLNKAEMDYCKELLDAYSVALEKLSIVGAKTVVHGEWIKYEALLGEYFTCNLCGAYAGIECNFCPGCGADMRKNGASRSNDGVEGGGVND